MMKSGTLPKKFSRWHWLALLIVILAFLALMVWANFNFAAENPGGNDFLPRYVGTRLFILEGISPYSEQTGAQIQQMIFGRPARADEDQSLFAYPFYSAALFFPFSLTADYALARALWMTFLEVLIVATALLALRLVNWKPSFWLIPFYFVFAVLWYHGLRSVINGNAVVVVAFLLVAAFAAIKKERDVVAGVLLACATIKPQLVIMPILFVMLWAFSQKRWRLIAATAGGALALVFGGMLFIPDWPLQNILAIMQYPDYTGELTLGAVFERWWPEIGGLLRWGLTLTLILLTALEWRAAYGQDFKHFLWTACFTLTASQWIGIATDPGNFIILFLPLVLIFAVLRKQWGKIGDGVAVISLSVLFFGLWGLFLMTVEYSAQAAQHPVMFIPLPLFVFVGLYAVRWFICRPVTRGGAIPETSEVS